jgi:uncharacterized protein Yka (UPF0111/DUF47 family)
VRLFRGATDETLLNLLEEAGRNTERSAIALREMLAEFPERADLARELLLCEQEGDRITHDLIPRLNGGGRGGRPFGPRDGHALATSVDDIVDYAEQAADSLGLYGIEAPMEQAEQMAEVLVKASREVAAALATFRTGADYSSHLVEIHRLENEGDRLVREAVASLFAGGIDPMVVIRWKDIFDSLEQAVDACEHVANLLEGISLKRRRRGR